VANVACNTAARKSEIDKEQKLESNQPLARKTEDHKVAGYSHYSFRRRALKK